LKDFFRISKRGDLFLRYSLVYLGTKPISPLLPETDFSSFPLVLVELSNARLLSPSEAFAFRFAK
jgi:hypothetical protein